MKPSIKILLLVFFCLSMVSGEVLSQTDADLVLINAQIITVNPNDDIVEAVAIKDSLFIAVGSNEDIEAYIGEDTEVRDLSGLTVTPGIIDAHTHMMYFGQTENEYVNLRPPEVTTIEEILNKVEERVNMVEAGDWIIGDGFFQLEDGRLPNKWDLDVVSPDNPVVLNSMGGHFGSANSMALEIAGITDTTPNPNGGIIERDSITGEANGILWNHPAMDMVRLHAPPLDTLQLINDVKYAQEVYLSEGLTSIHDVNTRGITRLYAYAKTALDGDLKIRVFMHHTIERPHDVMASLNNTWLFKYPMISYGGNKFLLDGQPPTSYTFEPHPGPSWNFPTWNPDTLQKYVLMLHREGRQISFHVMGDAAIDLALDVIELAQQDTLIPDIRHRLEHVMIPTLNQLQRMNDLDVLVCMQPGAIFTGGEFYIYYWGEERVQRLMPLRAMIDSSLHVSLGSDYPTVVQLDPRLALWSALVRKTSAGNIINTGQRITMKEALYAHTWESAYASHDEEIKGSVEIGKYADLTVWSDDLYAMEPPDILTTDVVMTIVGGTVYDYTNIFERNYPNQDIYRISSIAPNPFSQSTEIFITVNDNCPEPAYKLKLAIYNIMGDKIRTLTDKPYKPGIYGFTWDGKDTNGNRLTSAVYIVKLTDGKSADIKRVVLLD